MKDFTTMTELQLLHFAYFGILDIWLKEHEHLVANPDNKITKARFEKINARYEEIRARILELEQH